MSYRPVLSRRSLIPVAALVAVVMIAISSRALLAPALSFNQALESKRPKTPKNVVRADSTHTANSERPGKAPKPSPTTETAVPGLGLPYRSAFASEGPLKAFRELTKPDYLKLFEGPSPGIPLAPPV